MLRQIDGEICPLVLSLFVRWLSGHHGDGNVGNTSRSHVGSLVMTLSVSEGMTLHTGLEFVL